MMQKFFSVIGYLTTVIAAAFGILFLFNKFTERQIEDELENEEDEVDTVEVDEAEAFEDEEAVTE